MKLVRLDEKEFEAYASNHKYATFFQTLFWAKLKRNNGWDNELLGFKKDDKIIAATLMLSRVTPIRKKMFYAPRGFLLDYNNVSLLTEFVSAIKGYVKQKNGIFFKIDPYIIKQQRDIDGKIVEGGINNTKVINNLEKLGFVEQFTKPGEQSLQAKWMYWINLKDKTFEEIMSNMTSKTRQMIRKNEKNGVSIRECTYDDLPKFKEIMDHTSKRRGFLNRTLNYYQNMYNAFGRGKYAKLYFAELRIKDKLDEFKIELTSLKREYKQVSEKIKENKLQLKMDEIKRIENKIVEFEELYKKNGDVLTLGGILYFIYGKEVLSFIGGAYKEYMEFQPFYTLNYEMIKYACNNGYDYYNFYGIPSDLSENNSMIGVYTFKKGFGGEVVELIGEYDYPVSKFWYKIYKISFLISRKLKKIKK